MDWLTDWFMDLYLSGFLPKARLLTESAGALAKKTTVEKLQKL